MSLVQIQHYITDNIPLAQAMGVEVVACDTTSLTLKAPLKANINHMGTAFGGSISAIATLAAWSFLVYRLEQEGVSGSWVVKQNQTRYLAPIEADFTATAQLVELSSWAACLEGLERRGRGKIAVQAMVECGGSMAAQLNAEFVALA